MNFEKKELEELAQKYFDESFNYDWVGISDIASFYSLFSDKKLHKVLENDREYEQLRALHCLGLGGNKQIKIKCVHALKSLFCKIGFIVNEENVIKKWVK